MYRIGGIPLAVSPFFFVTAGLIGYLMTGSLIGMLIGIVIIFFSILIHELGHALSSKAFGQNPRIELNAFGGLTYPEGPSISKGREFIVVLMGPLFGFALAIFAYFVMRLVQGNVLATQIFYATFVINFVWTVINLVPVLPLDGGQLLRIVFEKIFGPRGTSYACLVSMVLAGAVAIFSFIAGWLIGGILFFLFAFQNFETFRRYKKASVMDHDDGLKHELGEIEHLLMEGRLEDAMPTLEKVREKAKEGILYTLCTQYLAQIYYKKKDFTKVYELLSPIYKDISPLELIMLHEASYEKGDFKLVNKISGECYKSVPAPEIALRAAKGAAVEQNVEACVGWLTAAKDGGVENVFEFIQDKAFDPIRDDPKMQHFKGA